MERIKRLSRITKGRIADILMLVKNFNRAISLLKAKDAECNLIKQLSQKVKDKGLDQGILYYKNDEVFRIGAAMVLANKYNLALEIGTYYGDCQAVLDKTKWANSLNPKVPSTDYGTWTKKMPNEVKCINGYGKTATEAILRCIINSKTAGVI